MAGANVASPRLSKRATFAEPAFATAKSILPSPLKSPVAIACGLAPVLKWTALPNAPSPLPKTTETPDASAAAKLGTGQASAAKRVTARDRPVRTTTRRITVRFRSEAFIAASSFAVRGQATDCFVVACGACTLRGRIAPYAFQYFQPNNLM